MPTLITSAQATIAFTDIVGSTALKARLGTAAYAELAARHDELIRRLVDQTPGAKILKDLGDGFMIRFASAGSAAVTTLRFVQELAAAAWQRDQADRLLVRVGIHEGEVAEIGEDVLGHTKIIGLPADLAARLQSIARPNQVLLTRAAFDEARQSGDAVADRGAEESDDAVRTTWRAHGAYRVRGAGEPIELFECGIEGVSPLAPPIDSEAARRSVTLEEAEMLGWRPAVGQAVPRRMGWSLVRKLGEGGFGEVWLSQHRKTRERRVVKFCFSADRLRSLRRELTLFRLLREALGDREDISRLHEVQLDEPPFFLEGEYSELGDLVEWTTAQGGLARVPIEHRLRLVIGMADAVHAAHSVGVLHKDIKPSNILMHRGPDGEARPRLTDFGIGVLTDRSQLDKHHITVAGFTVGQLTENESSRTGTRMYAPPETLIGRPFTVQGDVYALGVLLYQMVLGSLNEPLTSDWRLRIDDEVLRDDIAAAVAGDSDRRLRSAGELADRLRRLDARRQELAAKRRRETAERRWKRVGLGAGVAGVLMGLAAAGLGIALGRENRLRREAVDARERADTERAKAVAVSEFLAEDLMRAVRPSVRKGQGKDVKMRDVLDEAARQVEEASKAGGRFASQPEVEATVRAAIGKSYLDLGLPESAAPHLNRVYAVYAEADLSRPERADAVFWRARSFHDLGKLDDADRDYRAALTARAAIYGAEHSATIDAMEGVADIDGAQGRLDEAEKGYREVYRLRRKVLGENHADTLMALHNVGRTLIENGSFPEAAPLIREAWEKRRATLGPDDPLTLDSLAMLALVEFGQGRLAEAEPLLVDVVERRTRVLGPDHPDTLVSRNYLSVVMMRTNRAAEAEPIVTDIYERRRRVLGERHPETLISMNTVAMLHLRLGRLDAAEREAREVHELRSSVLGAEHVNTVDSLFLLAQVVTAIGRAEEADALWKRVVPLRERTSGKDKPKTVQAKKEYAAFLRKQGRNAEADAVSPPAPTAPK